MNRNSSAIRRVLVTLAGFGFLVLGMILSQEALFFLDRRMEDESQSVWLAVVASAIGVAMSALLQKALMRSVGRLLSGATPFISKDAIVSCVVLTLFGFGVGTAIIAVSGLLLYPIFGS